mgnify:CR=1 FL=1|jgi:hypothetical protein
MEECIDGKIFKMEYNFVIDNGKNFTGFKGTFKASYDGNNITK